MFCKMIDNYITMANKHWYQYLRAARRHNFNYSIKGEYHLYNIFVTVWLTTVIRVAFVLILLLLCDDMESNPQAWSKGI